MSKKVTMLEVWYYQDEWYCLFDRKRKALIRLEEYDEFKRNVHSLIKVKRKKIKCNQLITHLPRCRLRIRLPYSGERLYKIKIKKEC